jgi:hypothetical protein
MLFLINKKKDRVKKKIFGGRIPSPILILKLLRILNSHMNFI